MVVVAAAGGADGAAAIDGIRCVMLHVQHMCACSQKR